MIEVITPGPLSTVQDRGRPGYVALGVPRSGAFDVTAHDLANRLVGNPPDAATVECTFGGLSLRLLHAATLALTGAALPGIDSGVAVTLPAGSFLRLGTPPAGVRSYLAVRGGLDAPPVLDSRSTDTLGGLGPLPLRPGDRLPIGREPALPVPAADAVSRAGAAAADAIPVVSGPRADWFADDAMQSLLGTEWQVRSDSDRIGIRLDGPALARARTGELASEPTLPGAIQVPPDGRPIVLGPDAPVTGGYPVLAVVRRRSVDRFAQLRPGDIVRFRI